MKRSDAVGLLIGHRVRLYRRAFAKVLRGEPLEPEEVQVLSLGRLDNGGFRVPPSIDPTVK